MGRIVSLVNTTPDGFADGRHAIIDAEFYDFTHALLKETKTVAFGRHTFELFQERWPLVLEEENPAEWQLRMARVLNDKHKTVYSSTLKTTTWNNSSIIGNVDPDHINTYKQAHHQGVLTLGSLKLVATLTEMNLIDEYYFCIQPRIAGNGDVRLFEKMTLEAPRPLHYVDSTQLRSGVHIIHYQRPN